MSERNAFQRGLVTCCLAAGGFLTALYTGGASTSDIRARIPFLFGDGLAPIVFCALFALGLATLGFTGGWSVSAIFGVAFGALINLSIFLSGILPRIIPQLASEAARWTAFVVVLLLTGAALLHERRLNTNAPPSP